MIKRLMKKIKLLMPSKRQRYLKAIEDCETALRARNGAIRSIYQQRQELREAVIKYARTAEAYSGESELFRQYFNEAYKKWGKAEWFTRHIDTIDDGYQAWDIHCEECNQRTMQVVRPGKVQCSECG